MHIDGKLLVLVEPVVKSGLDIGAFQKPSRACPGLTRRLHVLVTRVLSIFRLSVPGPRTVPPSDVWRGRSPVGRGRRRLPSQLARHILAAPGRVPQVLCPGGAGPARRGPAFSVSVMGAGLAGRGPRWEGGGEQPWADGRWCCHLPQRRSRHLLSVAWAHRGGDVSKVTNVHKLSEAR